MPQISEFRKRPTDAVACRWPVLTIVGWLLCLLGGSRAGWARSAQPQRDPEFLIDVWNVEDGMPDESATAMVQTPDRYLWVGTFNGLARFDGVKFTVFNRSNTPELPNSGIVNLHLDSGGGLWVSTLKGLVRRTGGQWRNFNETREWTGDYARSFAENLGVVVVTSFNGKVIQFCNNRMTPLPDPPGEPGRGYFGYVDETGRIWVVQHRFFGWWDGQAWRPDESLSDLLGEDLCATPALDGGLWIVRGDWLYKFRGGTVTERRQLTQQIGGPWSLTEDAEGDIWVPSYRNGLYRIKPSGSVLRYTTESGLSYNGLRFTFQDHEGNRWVGSSGGGLMRLKRRTFASFGEEHGLQERVVKCVAEGPTGEIWAGTYGRGVARLSHGRFSTVWPEGDGQTNNVQSLLVDHHRRTWVGRFDLGLSVLDGRDASYFTADQSGGRHVTALFEDTHGNVWVGGSDTVVVYADQKSLEQLPKQQYRLPGVNCFAEDLDGRCIWAGNDAGLFRIDGDQLVEQQDQEGRSIRDVLSVYQHPGGALWIGTRKGLLRLKDERLTPIPGWDGQPVPTVGSILPDDLGYLWLGTRMGVGRASLAELESYLPASGQAPILQWFTSSDGLARIDCSPGNQPAAARDCQGHLWFATIAGLAMVDPKRVQLTTNPPPVYIEQVRVEDLSKEQKNLLPSGNQPLVIPPGMGEIGVFFSAPAYTAPEKVRFAYRIDGVNRSWVDIGNRRSLYFYPPSPGTYELRLKASSDARVWSQDGVVMSFVVQPFYWQTGWFRALALAGCAAGTGGVVWRVLSNKIRRQRDLLVEQQALHELAQRLMGVQDQERRRIGRELHDSTSQVLAALEITLAMTNKHADQMPPAMRGSLAECAALASQCTAEIRTASYLLHPPLLEELGLASALHWLVDGFSQRSGIGVDLDLPQSLPRLGEEYELALFRVVQEALTNVHRHSGSARARVRLGLTADRLELEVADDGHGIAKEKLSDLESGRKTLGVGVSGMRERLHQLGGEFKIGSSSLGTRVQVSLAWPQKN